MKNVLDESCRENKNTLYIQYLFLEKKKSAVYEII
jgi:hypothetical protein